MDVYSSNTLPALIKTSITLVKTFTAIEAAIDKKLLVIHDPLLIEILNTLKFLGGKIARYFIAIRDIVQNKLPERQAVFISRFYFMHFSIISENARASENIILYVLKNTQWLQQHAERIIESLKTLYADLLALETDVKELFRRQYNSEIEYDFTYRDEKTRHYTAGHMSIEEAFHLLELPMTAKQETIKAAFRKLAKQYHPDMNKNASQDMFIKIEQAYKRVLSVVR